VVCGGTAHPNMNTALATLASLVASYDEDYIDNNKNKSENENVNKNKLMDYGVDRPPAITK
jgi:hypothetical protein